MTLQRLIGNRATCAAALSRPATATTHAEPVALAVDRMMPRGTGDRAGPPVQRVLRIGGPNDSVEHTDPDEIRALAFEALGATALAVERLVRIGADPETIGHFATWDEAVAAYNFAADADDLARVPSAREQHARWLYEATRTLTDLNQRFVGMPLMHHEGTIDAKEMAHFRAFDDHMIWRFSSRPRSEVIFIEHGTSLQEIDRVIANHSGGNDKSNTRVRTLSFGRNIGALLGVARSRGGDKNVERIIGQAAYLYGIDVNTLPQRGITAHPARSRAISMFETEYILLSTPGAPPVSLDELATVKYTNPLRRQPTSAPSAAKGGKGPEDAGITIEHVDRLSEMPQREVDSILKYAAAAQAAADQYDFMVRDKEPILEWDPIERTLLEYIKAINRALGRR